MTYIIIHTRKIKHVNVLPSGRKQITFLLSNGKVPLSLTKSQHNRYLDNKRSKRSMKISMSERQYKVNEAHLHNKGGSLHSSNVEDFVLKHIKDKIRGKEKEDVVKAFRHLTGKGLSDKNRREILLALNKKYNHIFGKGFWDDFVKGFRLGWNKTLDIAKKIPIVKDIAEPLSEVSHAIGIGMKKSKKSKKEDKAGLIYIPSHRGGKIKSKKHKSKKVKGKGLLVIPH